MTETLISFFVVGLSFGWGPCLASCAPIVLSYIAGTGKNISKALYVYILFSIARILVYLLLSLLVFFFGNFLFEKYLFKFSKYILVAGGLFIILTGLLLAIGKRFEFKFCKLLQKNLLEHDKKSVFVFGLVIGFLPCVPLLAVFSLMMLIAKSWFDSLLLGFSFGLGTFVSPLFFLVIFAGAIPSLFKNKGYLLILNFICGAIIVFLGIQVIWRAF